MLLIDAIYINDSGGKILLDYLLQELEKSGRKCIYLLDKRVESKVPFLENTANEVYFLEGSLYKRHLFYLKHKRRIGSVLCFGDLPPSVKLKVKVYTYFHSELYIRVPQDSTLKYKSIFFLKRSVLRFLLKNSDFWMLQTETISENFRNKFKISEKKTLLLPFYPPLTKPGEIKRERDSFVFVSNAVPHKNHIRLINAFCKFYDQEKRGKLTITVDSFYQHLIHLIEEKQKQGYPIVNIGFIEREKLAEVYRSAEYLVYPSLAESFGLAILEAMDCGCKVIGADLPYLYAVCEPSLIFDPFDENSISKTLSLSLKGNLQPSLSKANNEIEALLKTL
ncbi:glycosyltransferase [Chryseobacterium caseinilyticum]|nr:glycosyltransferase [Chryseobacterium caseinilyticum]